MPYIPPMRPYPPNATPERREEMYWQYVDLCVACNPLWFLPIGVKKRWWHVFNVEHPETTQSRPAHARRITAHAF